MAKLTALQLMQEVQLNVGVATVTSLAALTGLNHKIFTFINDGIFEIGIKKDYKPLEALGTITLVTDTNTYAKEPTMNKVDKNSFRFDNSKEIVYLTAQEVDDKYPNQTNSGTPKEVYEFGDNFDLILKPKSGDNGKVINYRYWSLPTILSTATETGTSWFPEGFDRTVLVNWASYKTLQYRHNEEYSEYYKKVFGADGSIHSFNRIIGSPTPKKLRVTGKI